MITPRHAPRTVVIVVYPDVTLIDATGPVQVFSTANDVLETDYYEVVLASSDGGNVATDTGVTLGTTSLSGLARKGIDTLLVAGGEGVFDAIEDSRLMRWLHREFPTARRQGSTCMGSFMTVAAGLLDGGRTATHWRWADLLQSRYPAVTVCREPIFVRDGTVWSSAGGSSGIDMSIAMVEEDLGHQVAVNVARRLVVYVKRPGDQAQFSEPLRAQARDSEGRFDCLHGWIADNLAADLRVERLAEKAGMSARTFARSYARITGVTPAKGVELMRVDAAKRRLAGGNANVKEISHSCGFRDYERMRRAFMRHLGVSPADYRARFSSS